MQLAILTAVLASLAAAEGGGGPVAGVAWRLVVIACATLVAPLAAFVGTHRLAAHPSDRDDSDDDASRLESLVIGLWLAAVALILLVGQWPRIVRSNWQLAGLPLLDELAILLPVIAPLILIWAAMYRLERGINYSSAFLPRQLLAYVWLQARHQLAIVLLPPLAVVGVLESLSWLKIAPATLDSAKLDTAWWFALPLLAMMLVLMPIVVRRTWRTAPLPSGPLRDVLDGICHARTCRVREILVWNTGGTMANAAVVGLSRWLRYILLSDVLLNRLSDTEIAGVVRHELAHLRRWHLPLRLIALLLPVVGWIALKHTWPVAETAALDALTAIGLRGTAMAALIIPLGLLTYAVIVLGWYSRLLEHDADLDACLDDQGLIDATLAADFCTALVTLCGRARESWLSRWLHPPLEARISFIRRVITDHNNARAFRRKLTIVNASIMLLFAAAASLSLLS
jgi:Zn-dependent protease with chaperone function